MRRRDTLHQSESGLNIIENVLVLFVTLIVVIALFFFFDQAILRYVRGTTRTLFGMSATAEKAESPSRTLGQKSIPVAPAQSRSTPTQNAAPAISPMVAALFAALLASMAWNVKQLITSLTNRAQLRLLEILSSGERLRRRELQRATQGETFMLKLFPELINHALLALIMAGKVKLENGMYWIPSDCPTIYTKAGDVQC